MDDSRIPDTVVVSRLFWVAAANALRKQTGHLTSDEEESMTDEEAWQYVVRVARGEIVLKSPDPAPPGD